MPYSSFTFLAAKQTFGLTAIENSRVVSSQPLELLPSSWLQETLENNLSLAIAIGTEKARSELIIAPILVEIRKRLKNQISLFSGTEFNVDSDRGLNGICDFIISKSSEQLAVETPVLMMVEAKKADLNLGMGQVVAEMVAAQIFNQQQKQEISQVYGCVTSGTQWRFLCLQGKNLIIELEDRSLKPVEKILGALLQIIQN